VNAASIYRPAGFKSLNDYMQANPDQDAQVAHELKQSATSIVDYVTNAVGGVEGYDRQTAFRAMGELRTALHTTQSAPAALIDENRNRGWQLKSELDAQGSVTAGGQTIALEGKRDEPHPTATQVILPKGWTADRVRPDFSPERPNLGQKLTGFHQEGNITGAVVHYGAEKANLDQPHLWIFDGQDLGKLVALADEAAPKLRTLLSDPALDGQMDTETQAGYQSSSSSDEASTGGFLRRHTSVSSSDASSSGFYQQTQTPELQEGLGYLQRLEDGLGGIHSNDAVSQTLGKTRPLSEDVTMQVTTRHLVGSDKTEKTVPVSFMYGEFSDSPYRSIDQPSAGQIQLPYRPHTIDA
jgi:hypothetical protein